jgi:tellurium resistance protein TerZ
MAVVAHCKTPTCDLMANTSPQYAAVANPNQLGYCCRKCHRTNGNEHGGHYCQGNTVAAQTGKELFNPNFVAGAVERNGVRIKVLSCANLPAADANGKSDPYVKICDVKGLIGDGAKTKVVKKTLNPEWTTDNEFTFQTNFKLLALKFSVYDWDRFSSDDLLGKTYLPVSWLFDGQPHVFDLELHKGKHGPAPRGTLKVEVQMAWNFPVAVPGWWLPLDPTQISAVCVGLGWDFSKTKSLDLDASALCLNAKNKLKDMCSFTQLISQSRALHHSGDNQSGEGDGDDEVIWIGLNGVPQNVNKIAIVVNSYSSNTSLSMVKSAYVRVFLPGGKTLAFWRLNGSESKLQGLFLGHFVRIGSGWSYTTVGQEVTGNTAKSSLESVVQIVSALVPQ